MMENPLTYKSEVNGERKNIKQGILKGIPSSAGITIGKTKIVKLDSVILPKKELRSSEIPKEKKRFEKGLDILVNEFRELLKRIDGKEKNVVAIIESNLLLLQDPYVNGSIIEKIHEGNSAESAIINEFDSRKHFFKESKDEILRERAVELENIKKRLLSVLKHQSFRYTDGNGLIIVAQSLTPSDLVNFHDAGIRGLITEVGGIASHTSILARSFGIPAVIGVQNATEIIPDGSDLILDGYSGHIIYNPKNESIKKFRIKQDRLEEEKKKLGETVKLDCKTTDGSEIKLMANVDSAEDIHTSQIVGAKGAGLVRSEQLIVLKGGFPTEAEQIEYYAKIAESAYPEHVTIRTFDIGSDKYSEGMPHEEDNPALGFRGIRFLLSRKDIFKNQIRSILKVSKNKNVRLMLPMISNLREVNTSMELIEECKQELILENVNFDRNIPLGIMVETPAAALISDKFAKIVDFFSIGTNDLTQYTIAADRANELVSDVYDSFHPAVLQLIQMTVQSADRHNIPVSICGELAGHAAATSLLIGLGIRELSVSPSIIPELKNRIRHINIEKSKLLARDVLSCNSYKEVIARLDKEIAE